MRGRRSRAARSGSPSTDPAPGRASASAEHAGRCGPENAFAAARAPGAAAARYFRCGEHPQPDREARADLRSRARAHASRRARHLPLRCAHALPRAPLAAVLPGSAAQVRAVVRACYEAGRAVRRARRRHRPVGRRAAGRRGRPDRARRACAGSCRSTSTTGAVEVEPGRQQPRGLPRGRADALLPAGPLERERLLDRRQRRRERRRRALLQVRVHRPTT